MCENLVLLDIFQVDIVLATLTEAVAMDSRPCTVCKAYSMRSLKAVLETDRNSLRDLISMQTAYYHGGSKTIRLQTEVFWPCSSLLELCIKFVE